MEFLRTFIQINPEDELLLQYVLDNSHTGMVSKWKYNEFLVTKKIIFFQFFSLY